MPYFKWIGVDIAGMIKKGKYAAYSQQELTSRLFKQGIALLSCKPVYTMPFLWTINAQQKENLFKHIAQLLKAGILLPNALIIAAEQSSNPLIADLLFTINIDIRNGINFPDAVAKHNIFSDPIITIMLRAGHESGNLIHAIDTVALYFYKQHQFNKNIRSALAMPLLTLIFFIGTSYFIFAFIIPRFADMFHSLNQDLPVLTQYMIKISGFVNSGSMFLLLGLIALLFFIFRYCCITTGKKMRDKIIIQIPFIGSAIWQHQVCQILHALSLLLKSGVTLEVGLKVVSASIENSIIKYRFESLHDAIVSGQFLSSAMASSLFFLPEVIALTRVGEESGVLDQSLESAAVIYREKLDSTMRRFIFFLQPIVIILLGFLVTTLIFAVYLPIMQLSHIL